MDFEQQYNSVRASYQERAAKEKIAKKEIWEGFDVKVSALERVVADDFGVLVAEVGPITHKSSYKNAILTATVEKFRVIYEPETNILKVKIDVLKTGDGRIIEDNKGSCPHIYTEALERNPRVEEFMRRHHVTYIEEPDNNCEHK